jgi:hypothetical protein
LSDAGLHEYNIAQAGPTNSSQICYVLRDERGEDAGGIIGELPDYPAGQTRYFMKKAL